MSEGLSWMTDKKSHKDPALMVLRNHPNPDFSTFEIWVHKNWQNDSTKEYARWFTTAITDATGKGGDLGDAYVRFVVENTPYLIKVNGVRATDEQKAEFSEFSNVVLSRPKGDWE